MQLLNTFSTKMEDILVHESSYKVYVLDFSNQSTFQRFPQYLMLFLKPQIVFSDFKNLSVSVLEGKKKLIRHRLILHMNVDFKYGW